MFLYEAKQDPEVAKWKLIEEIEKKVLLAGRITLWPQLSWQCWHLQGLKLGWREYVPQSMLPCWGESSSSSRRTTATNRQRSILQRCLLFLCARRRYLGWVELIKILPKRGKSQSPALSYPFSIKLSEQVQFCFEEVALQSFYWLIKVKAPHIKKYFTGAQYSWVSCSEVLGKQRAGAEEFVPRIPRSATEGKGHRTDAVQRAACPLPLLPIPPSISAWQAQSYRTLLCGKDCNN